MIGTIFSIVLAILLEFNPYIHEGAFGIVTRGIIAASAILLLFLSLLAFVFAWAPLQKAEQNSTPRLLEMFRKDKHLLLTSCWLIAFCLLTIVLVSDLIYPLTSQMAWSFPLWLIAFGISLDVIRTYLKRISSYLNPFAVIKMFTQQAKMSIQKDKELDLCNWIDALAEVSIKGIQKHSTSVCHEALAQEQEIIQEFLSASKSIAHVSQDPQTKSLGIRDKVSYTLFYLYQRLDIIFDKALKNQLEPTCSLIITLLGKISVDAAKYDVSLASAPLRFLGKCAKKAQDQGLEETEITATCIFLEVAKEIITEIDLTYYEIKDAFLSIINGMEVLSKEAFKRDKTMNINLLIQPFKDLRALFENEKVKNHQDTPIILQNIDRVIGEYEALLIVMNTMPEIPRIEEENEPVKS